MPDQRTEAKRDAWRSRFDPRAPLAGQLDSPFAPAWQIAHVMGVSESTVYDSGKRFAAALQGGDADAARREVPCIIMGHSHRFPTAAFTTWFEAAGMLGSTDPESGGDPDVPTAGAEARVELAGARELVITIRLVLEDGALRALAEPAIR